MKSRKVIEFLRKIPDQHEFDEIEELPKDFDDGWTDEMVIAVAKRILEEINRKEGTNYKLEVNK